MAVLWRIVKIILYLLLAAAAAVLCVAISQFISLQKPVTWPQDVNGLDVGSARFMSLLATMASTSVEKGDDVTPIQGGDAFQAALVSEISNASSSIMITDFPWDGGSFTERVFTALDSAAQRHVDVKLLLDGFGGRTVPEQWIADLRDAGGKVVFYHPFNLLNPLQYNIRDHARTFIFDGQTAFTGGIGFVDYWIKDADGYGPWRDLMFEVHDNMAASLEVDFARLWKASTGETISVGVPADSAYTGTSTYMSLFGKPSLTFEPDRYAFLLTALGARKKLYIESAYFVPDQDLLDILEAKAKAGVDVRIISPGPITSAPILRSAYHADFEQLLKAGVKLYEYQPTMIHSKIMIADDVFSVIGSANIDDRSQSINVESVLAISDTKLAGDLDDIFMTDVGQSKEIDVNGWPAQYGFLDKLQSRFWLLFARQL